MSRPPCRATATTPPSAELLPQNLSAALDALQADREFCDLLSPRFVSTFLAFKRDELERFAHQVTDWEFREYAYHL